MLYWIPAILTAALIAWISHQPVLPAASVSVPDWLLHGIEYGFFALTLMFGTSKGLAAGRRTPGRIAAAVLIATLYGITDEYHQSFVGRDATVRDWLADSVGAALMGLTVLAVGRRFDRLRG